MKHRFRKILNQNLRQKSFKLGNRFAIENCLRRVSNQKSLKKGFRAKIYFKRLQN